MLRRFRGGRRPPPTDLAAQAPGAEGAGYRRGRRPSPAHLGRDALGLAASRTSRPIGRPIGGGSTGPASPLEARFTLHVQPRASRNEIVAVNDTSLRVRVTARPADGAANRAVRDLLAQALDCARSDVEIVRGHSTRMKVIRIAGLSSSDVTARLAGGR